MANAMEVSAFTRKLQEKWSIRVSEVHGTERMGQSLFNALEEDWPDIAEEVRGKDFDPFYKDENIPRLFDWIWKVFYSEAQ
jgi:hypothetical protein